MWTSCQRNIIACSKGTTIHLICKLLRAAIKICFLGGDYSRSFMDIKDAQWLCVGDLQTADINQLTAREFVIYRYGVFIIKLLHQAIQTPEVTLLLATNLPQNNYDQNAFRSELLLTKLVHC